MGEIRIKPIVASHPVGSFDKWLFMQQAEKVLDVLAEEPFVGNDEVVALLAQ